MNISAIPDDSKVILIGEQTVGKTTISNQLSNQLTNQGPSSNYNATVGASFISKDMETKCGNITLHIWDTAGQERYRSLIPLYARNSVAAIVVFDCTRRETYDDIYETWVNQALNNTDKKIQIYIVANKIDQTPTFDLSIPEAEAKEHGYKFFKVSAFQHDTVEALFREVAEDIAEIVNEAQQDTLPQEADRATISHEDSKCC